MKKHSPMTETLATQDTGPIGLGGVLSRRWTALTFFISISTPELQGIIGRFAAMDTLFQGLPGLHEMS
jgi:hypothetical protein